MCLKLLNWQTSEFISTQPYARWQPTYICVAQCLAWWLESSEKVWTLNFFLFFFKMHMYTSLWCWVWAEDRSGEVLLFFMLYSILSHEMKYTHIKQDIHVTGLVSWMKRTPTVKTKIYWTIAQSYNSINDKDTLGWHFQSWHALKMTG